MVDLESGMTVRSLQRDVDTCMHGSRCSLPFFATFAFAAGIHVRWMMFVEAQASMCHGCCLLKHLMLLKKARTRTRTRMEICVPHNKEPKVSGTEALSTRKVGCQCELLKVGCQREMLKVAASARC